MKALVYTAPCEVVHRDEPDPVAGPGDVLIRVDWGGIFRSDLHS